MTSVTLSVRFAPVVSLTTSEERPREGSDVKLLCNAEGNPPSLSYSWFVGNRKALGNHLSDLGITQWQWSQRGPGNIKERRKM